MSGVLHTFYSLDAENPPPPPTGHAILPEEVVFDDKNCANCGEAGAKFYCSGCKVTDVGQIRVFYCGKLCQKGHWDTHKNICRARRQLGRVVSIFSDLWTSFEVGNFTSNIDLVGEERGIISIDVKATFPDPRGWTGMPLMRTFPDEVIPRNTSEAVKRALLFDSGCGDVLVVAASILNILLKPVCADIQVAGTEPKDRALIVWLRGEPHLGHTILRVALPTGELFAIDFAGAQYGWQEQLYTWATYVKHRTMEGVRLHETPFGCDSEWTTDFVPNYPKSLSGAAFLMRKAVLRKLEASLYNFFISQNCTARALVTLPESEFVTAREQLVTHAKAAIQGTLRDFKEKGVGRIYFGYKFGTEVTLREEFTMKLGDVWLSDEEMRANEGDEDALKGIWQERMARILF